MACNCPLDVLAADLGMPNSSYSFYEAIKQIASQDPILHEDTETILLDGEGTADSPLVARLAPGAITSSDSTVTVVQEADGTFNLSVAAQGQKGVVSTDGSIGVVEGATNFDLSLASTFTGSNSVDVVRTPSNPPNYAFSLSSTAIVPSNDPSLAPVDVVFSGGQFFLGVAMGPAGGIIPRTITVGGIIGSTPSAVSLASAVALLPPGPFPVDQPWTLLILPGLYPILGTVVVPPNVNLVALERHSSTLSGVGSIILEDSSGDITSTSVVGLRFSGGLDLVIDSEDKTGGSHITRIENCIVQGVDITSSLRAGDSLRVFCCEISSPSTVTLGGGSVDLSQCDLSCNVSSNATTSISVSSGRFSPTLLLANDSTLEVTSATLGGDWRLSSPGTVATITSCRPTISWTMRCNNSSRAYIRSTELPLALSVVDAETWNVSFPNLPTADAGAQGEVDRRFALGVVIPGSVIASLLHFILPVPLIDPNPSLLVASRLNQVYASDTTTGSTLILVNQSTLGGKLSLAVSPIVTP